MKGHFLTFFVEVKWLRVLFSRGLSPSAGGEPAVVVLQKLLAGFWQPRAGIRQTEPQRR